MDRRCGQDPSFHGLLGAVLLADNQLDKALGVLPARARARAAQLDPKLARSERIDDLIKQLGGSALAL
jgi:hypothetical protein